MFGLGKTECYLHSCVFTSHRRYSPRDLGGRKTVHSLPSPVKPLELEKLDRLIENHDLGGRVRMTSARTMRAHDDDRKPCQLILHSLTACCCSGSPGIR